MGENTDTRWRKEKETYPCSDLALKSTLGDLISNLKIISEGAQDALGSNDKPYSGVVCAMFSHILFTECCLSIPKQPKTQPLFATDLQTNCLYKTMKDGIQLTVKMGRMPEILNIF